MDDKNATLRTAAEHLAAGDWETAHPIVQDDTTALGAWAHGIVHILEGDESNARYWYGRAGRPYPGKGALQAEIVALKQTLR